MIALLAVLALATGLRLVGVDKDLWLDEIWSIDVAAGLRSPLAALTLHHEINHYLNTIWLYLVGPGRGSVVYHLVAFISGVASVATAGLIGLRRDRATALFMMLVFAMSYELVLYSSEARGYSTLVLFSLLSFYCLESCINDAKGGRWIAGYAAFAVAGLLSHPVFVSVLTAGVAWTVVDTVRSRRTMGGVALAVLRIHGIPLACFALLYVIDLRLIVAGGGTPARSLIDAYGTSFAWALGTLRGDAPALVSCIVAVILLDLGLRHVSRAGSTSWVFFAVAIAFPVVVILVRGSDLVYTRHFLVSTIFLLMLFGLLLASWWTRGQRVISGVMLAVYCGVNGWHTLELAVRGRGQYREAIKYMVDRTPGPTLTIGGDQDFRIGTELAYYLPRDVVLKRAQYIPHGSWPAGGPQWLITQRESFEPVRPVDDHIVDPAGHDYELVETFPTAPLSGLHWYLYRNRSSP